MKGPFLMQSAISALQSCQPYAMLPADRYNEWKVLDPSFTARDFGGASQSGKPELAITECTVAFPRNPRL